MANVRKGRRFGSSFEIMKVVFGFLWLFGATTLTHSHFNDELNPAIEDYVKEAKDEMNPKVAQRWSERRRKYLQMVAGMNNMWNNGKKDEILATAQPASGYPGSGKMSSSMPSPEELARRYGSYGVPIRSKSPRT